MDLIRSSPSFFMLGGLEAIVFAFDELTSLRKLAEQGDGNAWLSPRKSIKTNGSLSLGCSSLEK